MYNDEKKAQFVELRARGDSFGKISSELAISKRTAIAWSKERAPAIAARREELWVELTQKFRLSNHERLERLAKQLNLVENLLADGSIGDMDGKDLMKFYLLIDKRISEIIKDASNGADGSMPTDHESSLAPTESITEEAAPAEETGSVSLENSADVEITVEAATDVSFENVPPSGSTLN